TGKSLKTLHEDLLKRIESKNGKNGPVITVLLVTTYGGSSGESQESRIRDRYAIASALGVACYAPVQEDQVSYVVWKSDNKKDRAIPYEWYEKGARLCSSNDSERAEAVLVLWVSGEILEKQPINVLQSLTESLRCTVGGSGDGTSARCNTINGREGKQSNLKDPVRFKIIGPRDSSSFGDLLKEALRKKSDAKSWVTLNGEIELYSPWATAMPKLLMKEVTDEQDQSKQGEPEQDQSKQKNCAMLDKSRIELCQVLLQAGIVLKHSIGSDDQLLITMTEELERRQVKFGRDMIILIGEWDSAYGRLLPVEFTAAVCHRIAKEGTKYEQVINKDSLQKIKESCLEYPDAVEFQLQDPSKREDDALKIRRYSYLRGLDGEMAGKGKSEGGKANDTKEGKNSLFEREMLERPVGTSQFDYVQRLASRIERDVAEEADLQQHLRANEKFGYEESRKPVAAIGILGSDAYDALLMLQALRERFPGTVFFATDLDSRLVYAEDYQWTRNLVIASHYGLELSRFLQNDVPPFRSSYQTSTYFSVLQAVGHVRPLDRCPQENVQAPSSLGSYPIGSSCGYRADLTVDGMWFRTAEPPRIYEVGRHGAVDLSVMGEGKNGKTLHPTRIDLSNGEFQADGRRPSAKMFYVTISLFCSITFIIVWMRPTTHQWMTQNKQLAILGAACLLGLIVFIEKIGLEWLLQGHDQGEPFFWFEGVSVWPTELLRGLSLVLAVALLVKGWKSLRSNVDAMSEEYECTPQKDSVQSEGWGRAAEIARWVLAPRDRSHDWHAGSLWHLYREAGFTRHRLMRLLILVVFYTAIFILLWIVFGTENFSGPCRGLFSCRVDLILVWASYAGLTVLNLFVFDAVLLCRRWIGALTQASKGWPAALTDHLGWQNQANIDKAQELMKIELVAQRTTVVNRLVRYPFLILLIMMVARNSYFDDWHFPLVMIVGWVINALLAIAAALLLYRAAERARQASLTYLNQHILKALDRGDGHDGNVKLTRQVVKDIEGVSHGAFVPLWQQPVVESSFYGVFAVLQYLYLV
ncbi:MAG: hypothetical protein OEY86_09665, partial [Nitrospira sp.]|nr:hypothetical protein [Nitrospira sp.]